MISYFGSLVQFSPAAGRAGRCRQMSLCVGSTLWPGSHGERPGQPHVCAPCLLPPRPQRAPMVWSQEVFRQEPGPVCRVGGGGFSGAEFARCPSPCLLTPAGIGRFFSGVSQPLCFANRRGVFLPVNFSTLPQFKKSLPPTALRAFWPVYTLSNAAGSSPLRPLLLAAGAGVRGTFLLGVAFRHVICGPYLISPPG